MAKIETFLDLYRKSGNALPAIPASKVGAMGTAPFDAAGRGRRGLAWNPTRLGVNTLVYTQGDTLQRRSRDAVRNSPWAAAAIDSYVANAIGRGIRMVPQHPTQAINDQILKVWNRWCQQCDAQYQRDVFGSGRMDFAGIQQLVVRELMEGGEVFARFHPRPKSERLAIPVQIQLIESEQLPLWRTNTDAIPNGNALRSGIEFDGNNRRVAYHFYKAHPGETMFYPLDGLQTIRVPAEYVLHVYKMQRADQFRGTPWLTAVLAMLYELNQYQDSEIVRKKTASMITGFIRQVSSDSAVMPADQGLAGPLQGNEPGASITRMEPGSFPVLLPGEDITLATQTPDAGYASFVTVCLNAFAAGAGLQYFQISGDLTQVNYSSLRAGLLEFQRKAEQFQHAVFIHQFCRPVFQFALREAVISGALRLPNYADEPEQYEDVRWVTPGWPWVDPMKDTQASILAIRANLSSLSSENAALGQDFATIAAENARDNARLDALGIISDADPRQTLSRGETVESAPESTAPPANDQPPAKKTGLLQ